MGIICYYLNNTLFLGDILIAAGIIAYLGPFTAAFRNDQVRITSKSMTVVVIL